MVHCAHGVMSHQEKIRQANEDKFRQQAFTDLLTHLPNRNQFIEDIALATTQSTQKSTQGALLFLDLDRFKLINNSLGHDAGDQLLRIVSSRNQECTRQDDTCYRISGDEFIVLMQNLENADDSANLANRIMSRINEPVTLGDQEILVNVSIGITCFNNSEKHIDDLVKEADTAMYRAKQSAGNSFEVYTPDLNMVIGETLQIETKLQRAIKSNQFVLHYQPKVDTVTRNIRSVEALLRWQHPENGLTPPEQFMTILEETGLIITVGRWVLLEACRQAQSWVDDGLNPIRISVNISKRQFHDKNLVSTVKEVLDETGLNAQYLELEMSERTFIEDTEFSTSVMLELKALGVMLAIDDFGSGYSSLKYLRQLPIDYLKIDRSGIKDMAKNDKDESLLAAIAAMARSLSVKMIAEGIEDEAQFNLFQEKGCDELQGFLFSQPLPAKDF